MARPESSIALKGFGLSNPKGPGQGNVPRLLRRVADELESLGDVEVYELILHPDMADADDGYWPTVVVYYDTVETPTRNDAPMAPLATDRFRHGRSI